MTENNMELWNKVKQPPTSALKKITGGRLNGKTDINPMWRYSAMTEIFGPCGIGWYFEVNNKWVDEGPESQRFAFADITLYIKIGEEWSKGIPGSGGSMLIEKEKSGLHSNDEAFKMSITDALGAAMKMLGLAADIYAGKWDGSKYKDAPEDKKKLQDDVPDFQPIQTQASEEKAATSPNLTSQTANAEVISPAQGKRLFAISRTSGIETEQLKMFLMHFYGYEHSNQVTKNKYEEICNLVSSKEKFSKIMETI